MKWQLQFKHSGGGYSCRYIESESDEERNQMAIDETEAYVRRMINQPRAFFESAYKPPRKIIVREYDAEKKQPKKGGLRFVLYRMKAVYTMRNGDKVTEYSYYVDNVEA